MEKLIHASNTVTIRIHYCVHFLDYQATPFLTKKDTRNLLTQTRIFINLTFS